MTSSESEDVITAPWVGPINCKNILSVIVLSSNPEIINKIAQALIEVHVKGNFSWKLAVIRSLSFENIVKHSDVPVAMDFIVLGIDTSKIISLEWTKNMIQQMHPDLRCRRVVLVNASGLPILDMAISPEELIDLQTEMDMDMLTANVFDPEDAAFLARRLLTYMEVSVGVKTGVPNLNI